jgi:lysophospholipase L1-like esterase
VRPILLLIALLGIAGCNGCSQPRPKPLTGLALSGDPGDLSPQARAAAKPRDSGHPLARFYQRLAEIDGGSKTAQASVLHFGDSHSASDSFTGPLRERLVTRFGDGGRGFLLPGLPWKGYAQRCADYEMSGGWQRVRAASADSRPPFGMGAFRLETGTAGDTVSRGPSRRCSLGTDVDRVRFHALAQPGGGSVDLYRGNELIGRRSTAADELGLLALTIDLPAGGSARLSAVGDGPVSLLGSMGERDASGISYSVAAFNGAQASQFLRGNSALVAAEVAAAAPTLLVYAFGTNEAWGVAGQTDNLPAERRAAAMERGAAGVTSSLQKWLRLTRSAAPDSDCLVILPPDATRNPKQVRACLEAATTPAEVETCNVSEPAVAAVSAAFTAMSEAEGCATWDIAAAMGGTGSMWEWMAAVPTRGQADGVHLTSAGYALVGARLAGDLLENFELWKRGESFALPTGRIEPAAQTVSGCMPAMRLMFEAYDNTALADAANSAAHLCLARSRN